MYSVEKTGKISQKPFKLSKKPEPHPQISPRREKSFEKSSKNIEPPPNEQNSFLSKETSSKRKIKAIVTLNIEEDCEKLIVYEGQDIYELAANITKKYQLSKDFTNYITENINKQIEEHNNQKKRTIINNNNNVFETNNNNSNINPRNNYQNNNQNAKNDKNDDGQTPKFKRNNNFNFENLNTSKSVERVSKSPRQRSTSPIKRDQTPTKSNFNHENINLKQKNFEKTNVFKKKTLNFSQEINEFFN